METVDSLDTGSSGLRLISCYYLGLRKIKFICQNIRFPAENLKTNVLDLTLNCFAFRPCAVGASEAVLFPDRAL